VYHFFKTIFSYLVPVCAATNFLKSPTVSVGLALILTFLPRRSLTDGEFDGAFIGSNRMGHVQRAENSDE